MTFRVGQKVVCIKDPVCRINDMGLRGYRKGCVYTVAALEVIEPYGLFISVEELHPDSKGHHLGFRPIVEQTTDISIFTKMLNPSKVNA